MPVRFSIEASADIDETINWYNNKRAGLGDEFLGQLNVSLDNIEAGPQTFPVVRNRVRRAVLRRFPYCVFFVVRERDIVLFAVLHGKRNPEVGELRSVQ